MLCVYELSGGAGVEQCNDEEGGCGAEEDVARKAGARGGDHLVFVAAKVLGTADLVDCANLAHMF